MGEIEYCVGSEETEVKIPDSTKDVSGLEAKEIPETETTKIKETEVAPDKKGTAKLVKSLSDKEYEDIFTAVLKCTSAKNLDCAAEEDDFETIIKDDEHMASQYVEAFVSDSQENEGDAKEVKQEEDNAQNQDESVQIDGEQIQEFGDDVTSEDLQALNENTPELEPDKITAPKVPQKKKIFRKRYRDSSRSLKLDNKMGKGDKTKTRKHSRSTKNEMTEENLSKEPSLGKQKNSTVSNKQKIQGRTFLETGTWVQCENKKCMKWRYLEDIHDPACIPEKWTCAMTSGLSCSSPEDEWDEDVHSEEFVFTKFTEGSVVWARMPGYPWWPGMVEIDPDFKTFFECTGSKKNVATGYHVVFLDEKVSRAWINMKFLKPFNGENKMGSTVTKGHNYYKAIEKSSAMAKEAMGMSLEGRLHTFGFAKRFKGKWGYDLAANGVMDPGPSTSGYKPKKVKKRSQVPAKTRHLGSPGFSEKSTNDMLLKTLGMERKEVEYYIENAEEIIKGAENVLEEFFSSQSNRSQSLEISDDSDYEDEGEKKKLKKEKLAAKPAKGPEKMKENSENNADVDERVSSKGKAPKKGNKGLKISKTSRNVLKSLSNTSTNRQDAVPKETDTEDTSGTKREKKSVQIDGKETKSAAVKNPLKENKEMKQNKKESVKMSENNKVNQGDCHDKKKPVFAVKKKAPQFGIPVKKRKIDYDANLKNDGKNDDETIAKSEKQEKSTTINNQVTMTFDPDVFTMDANETQIGDNEIKTKKTGKRVKGGNESETEKKRKQTKVENETTKKRKQENVDDKKPGDASGNSGMTSVCIESGGGGENVADVTTGSVKIQSDDKVIRAEEEIPGNEEMAPGNMMESKTASDVNATADESNSDFDFED